jgi:hypothetical protein
MLTDWHKYPNRLDRLSYQAEPTILKVTPVWWSLLSWEYVSIYRLASLNEQGGALAVQAGSLSVPTMYTGLATMYRIKNRVASSEPGLPTMRTGWWTILTG